MRNIFESNNWRVEYIPEDGGRLSRLQYSGIDLLTLAPESFVEPKNDFGLYETRPVYGYDDCFPTVDSCIYPNTNWSIPDHGELCWLDWSIAKEAKTLSCSVESEKLPITFYRNMIFDENQLIWHFEIENNSDDTIYFQHVMHALMPLGEIIDLNLPDFKEVFDEINGSLHPVCSPRDLKNQLLSQTEGTASMLILRGLQENRLSLSFKSGLKMDVEFPLDLFPSLGIWWNNLGYPNEEGCRRCECAFEAIPGNDSVLKNAFEENMALKVDPFDTLQWQIIWRAR